MEDEEFIARIKRDYDQYGERARMAERSKGIDWKALSHAFRALIQMDELIETGRIKYPLSRALEIKEIKAGLLPFSYVDNLISAKIELINTKLSVLKTPLNVKDPAFIQKVILSFYSQD